MESRAVQPALWIFQGLVDLCPLEAFVIRGVAVSFKSRIEIASFVGRQEFGRFRAVEDEKVCHSPDDDSEYAFLSWSELTDHRCSRRDIPV